MPNSAYPPHVGHAAMILHARASFLYTKFYLESYNTPGIDLRWGVVHDVRSTPEFEKMQVDLMNWMGYPPEFELRLNEYGNFQADVMCMLLKMEIREADFKSLEIGKFMVLNSVRTHIRGVGPCSVRKSREAIGGRFWIRLPNNKIRPIIIRQ